MGVFSPAYKNGFIGGVALGGMISLWWTSRDSIYERVKGRVEAEKH
jgi:hypothetical protein